MKIQPPSQRTIPTLLIAISFTLIGSLLGAQPARAALMAIPTNVSVVYLTGTYSDWDQSCGNKYSINHALDVKWLHQRLVSELQINNKKAFSLNYYCPQERARNDQRGNELPRVTSVTEASSPILGCMQGASKYIAAGMADTGWNKKTVLEPVMRHAYHVAWWLDQQIKLDRNQEFLFIGHSQGGILMRLVFIMSDPKRRDAIRELTGQYAPKCWPNIPSVKFYGNIFMGTPFLGGLAEGVATCNLGSSSYELCDIMNTGTTRWPKSLTRKVLERHSLLLGPSSARQIQLGGSPVESAGFGTISDLSSTALLGGRTAVIEQFKTQMLHEDWFNADRGAAGACPANRFGFCVYFNYEDFQTKTIKNSDETQCSGCPGNVYDLIISVIKKWWS